MKNESSSGSFQLSLRRRSIKQGGRKQIQKNLVRSFFGLLTIFDLENYSMAKLNSGHQAHIIIKWSVPGTNWNKLSQQLKKETNDKNSSRSSKYFLVSKILGILERRFDQHEAAGDHFFQLFRLKKSKVFALSKHAVKIRVTIPFRRALFKTQNILWSNLLPLCIIRVRFYDFGHITQASI